MKEDVIVDTKLIPCKPVLKSWLPVEVTHVETPIRFYIRYIYGPGWNLGTGTKRECIGLHRWVAFSSIQCCSLAELPKKKDAPEKNVILHELTQDMT